MSYQYITEHNASAYTPRALVAAVFKAGPRPLVPVSDVVHHWDDPAKRPTFEGTVRWFETQPPTGSSSHYVLEAGRVACMVNEADAAHTNGHAAANARCVAWECNPRCSNADRETLAQALSDAWVARGMTAPGRVELHRMYQGTECPGRYIQHLPAIQARAGQLFYAKRAGQTEPHPAPAPVNPPQQQAPGTVDENGPHWVVEAGDTLGEIAEHYGVEVERVARHNGIEDPNRIEVGQRVFIPAPLVWIVEDGDTLSAIGKHYGIPWQTIAENNGVTPQQLPVGAVLRIY